jgi:hypothetical protein
MRPRKCEACGTKTLTAPEGRWQQKEPAGGVGDASMEEIRYAHADCPHVHMGEYSGVAIRQHDCFYLESCASREFVYRQRRMMKIRDVKGLAESH